MKVDALMVVDVRSWFVKELAAKLLSEVRLISSSHVVFGGGWRLKYLGVGVNPTTRLS